MGDRIGTDQLTLDAPLRHPVEIFCVGSHTTGTLQSVRPRVSDHLEADDQVIEVLEATLRTAPGATPVVEDYPVYINKPMVLFVLDLTPAGRASGSADAVHPTESHEVFASVGDFWIAGQLRLPIGGDPMHFLSHSPRKFVPIAEADILGYDEQTPCTVLVNREQLEAIVVRQPEIG